MIHVKFRPLDPNIPLEKYNWPAYMVLSDVGEGEWYKKSYPILYEMSEHQALSGKICLQARTCHNPFQPWSKDVPPCWCNADDSLKRESDRLREETAQLSAQVQQERRSRAQTERALIDSLPNPSTIECAHLEAGRCNGRDKCKFLHTEEALERAKTKRCCLTPKGLNPSSCLKSRGFTSPAVCARVGAGSRVRYRSKVRKEYA